LLTYAKTLVTLRKKNPALRSGDYKRLFAVDGTCCYSRTLENETFIVGMNVSESAHHVEVQYDALTRPMAMFGKASDISVGDGNLKFTIPARSGVVLK
jgi:hypothetical protein